MPSTVDLAMVIESSSSTATLMLALSLVHAAMWFHRIVYAVCVGLSRSLCGWIVVALKPSWDTSPERCWGGRECKSSLATNDRLLLLLVFSDFHSTLHAKLKYLIKQNPIWRTLVGLVAPASPRSTNKNHRKSDSVVFVFARSPLRKTTNCNRLLCLNKVQCSQCLN